ncbi:sensor histidine kinase [Sphingomonas flavalba]|uniref:sensor histidine kinase n=1 Tax=Sphingomonas flavalba TaxID=2559804 RepID=UPI00109DCE6C|nr:ATP-binding protein [Sphingomonas flavalba]
MPAGAPRLWRSLTFRLALLYIGLFAVSVGLLFGVLYWLIIARPMQDMAGRVSAEAAALVATDARDGRPALLAALDRRLRDHGDVKPFHALVAADGRVVSANLPSWPAVPFAGSRRLEADLYSDGDEDDHEALMVDRRLGDGARLLVGRDIEMLDDREELFAGGAAWVVAIAALLAVFGSIAMSAVVARRIDAVGRTARRVMAGNLGERIPVRGTGDDFDDLAETLNRMLDRIEDSMESNRRISDSIAHELRTPLARLHADLDDLAASEPGPAERSRLIGQAVEEARRLQAVFDALLRIARIETGLHDTGVRRIDLSTLLRDAAEFYGPEAEARDQRLTAAIPDGLAIEGDPDLLFQAVSNLLDNAIKYAPVGGQVTLETRRDGARIAVTITDDGPGIAPEHRARVTERFYRAPGTVPAPGIGLGLSLVAAVARLHRAELVIHDGGRGRISLILPVARGA